MAAVHLVHGGEVAHVLQEHRGLHHAGHGGAGRLEDRRQVSQNQVRLLGDVAVPKLHGLGIQGDLTGTEDETAHHHGLGIGPDGGRCVVGLGKLHVAHGGSR